MRSLLAILGLSACANTDNVVLVSSEVGTGQGVDLATLAITGETASRDGADFCVGQAMVVSLRGAHDETFCAMGRDFTSLADIPIDTAMCGWSPIAYLGASSDHAPEESYVAGDGYLVRDRAAGALYRVLVVHDAYDAGTAVVTLEIEPVP